MLPSFLWFNCQYMPTYKQTHIYTHKHMQIPKHTHVHTHIHPSTLSHAQEDTHKLSHPKKSLPISFGSFTDLSLAFLFLSSKFQVKVLFWNLFSFLFLSSSSFFLHPSAHLKTNEKVGWIFSSQESILNSFGELNLLGRKSSAVSRNELFILYWIFYDCSTSLLDREGVSKDLKSRGL